MIAADTSSLSSFLQGEDGPDVERLAIAASAGELLLPPVVLTEILSDADLFLSAVLSRTAIVELKPGYWERAGATRRLLKQNGLRSKVADTLIAQACIDHDLALITRDGDFRHFATHCGLRLAI